MVSCNFLKNVKTLEPKTYITILSIPQAISGRNIKGSIFTTLCHPSRGGQGDYRGNENFQFTEHKYMLLASWEVRVGKNCDRGLENAARGRKQRTAFSFTRSISNYQGCMTSSTYQVEYNRHVARPYCRPRFCRASSHTSNTASHEKINPRVSFSFQREYEIPLAALRVGSSMNGSNFNRVSVRDVIQFSSPNYRATKSFILIRHTRYLFYTCFATFQLNNVLRSEIRAF